MILWHDPPDPALQALLDRHAADPFSYPAVGDSRSTLPQGYVVDHHRINLGQGKEVYASACRLITTWTMFHLNWIRIYPRCPRVDPGTTVTIIAHLGPMRWVNFCRIVYLLKEQEPWPRFGFAYGTLIEHAESGEERFTIEFRPDGTVYYDLLAFSRPQQLLVRFGYPLARLLQKRFARDSLKAMKQALRPRRETEGKGAT